MARKKDRNKAWVKRDRKARDEGSRWIKALRENNIVSSERQGGMEKRNGKRVSEHWGYEVTCWWEDEGRNGWKQWVEQKGKGAGRRVFTIPVYDWLRQCQAGSAELNQMCVTSCSSKPTANHILLEGGRFFLSLSLSQAPSFSLSKNSIELDENNYESVFLPVCVKYYAKYKILTLNVRLYACGITLFVYGKWMFFLIYFFKDHYVLISNKNNTNT